MSKNLFNKWRAELKLPPIINAFGFHPLIERQQVPIIYEASPALLSKASDFTPNIEMTGALYLTDNEKALALELQQFIDAGPPPVFLGFGNMPASDPKKLINIAVEVVNRTNNRVLLCAGWPELQNKEYIKNLPDKIFIFKAAPYLLLFPRCLCMVHHCGSGSTHAAIKSGSPSVPVPVMLDQPYFAEKLYKAGVAAKPIMLKDLTADKLVAGIIEASTKELRANAKVLASEVMFEGDGVEAALSAFKKGVDRNIIISSEMASFSTIHIIAQMHGIMTAIKGTVAGLMIVAGFCYWKRDEINKVVKSLVHQ